jgi:hypothetical protein
MKTLFLIFFGLFSILPVTAQENGKTVSEHVKEGWYVSGPMTIHEVELQSLEELRSAAPRVPQVPFGFANADWITFKNKMEPGDTLVRFSSSGPGLWIGYAIVRSGVMIDTFTVTVS